MEPEEVRDKSKSIQRILSWLLWGVIASLVSVVLLDIKYDIFKATEARLLMVPFVFTYLLQQMRFIYQREMNSINDCYTFESLCHKSQDILDLKSQIVEKNLSIQELMDELELARSNLNSKPLAAEPEEEPAPPRASEIGLVGGLTARVRNA